MSDALWIIAGLVAVPVIFGLLYVATGAVFFAVGQAATATWTLLSRPFRRTP